MGELMRFQARKSLFTGFPARIIRRSPELAHRIASTTSELEHTIVERHQLHHRSVVFGDRIGDGRFLAWFMNGLSTFHVPKDHYGQETDIAMPKW